MEGVYETSLNSKKKKKHVHLLHLLHKIFGETMSQEVYEYTFPKIKRGWTSALQNQMGDTDKRVFTTKVVYITPNQPHIEGDFGWIGFEEVANVVERKGPLGRLISCYLRKWACEDAGSLDPRTGHLFEYP